MTGMIANRQRRVASGIALLVALGIAQTACSKRTDTRAADAGAPIPVKIATVGFSPLNCTTT